MHSIVLEIAVLKNETGNRSERKLAKAVKGKGYKDN